MIDIGDMVESEKDEIIEAADALVALVGVGPSGPGALREALAAYRKARACGNRCESPTCDLPRGHEGGHAGGGHGNGGEPVRIIAGSFVEALRRVAAPEAPAAAPASTESLADMLVRERALKDEWFALRDRIRENIEATTTARPPTGFHPCPSCGTLNGDGFDLCPPCRDAEAIKGPGGCGHCYGDGHGGDWRCTEPKGHRGACTDGLHRTNDPRNSLTLIAEKIVNTGTIGGEGDDVLKVEGPDVFKHKS